MSPFIDLVFVLISFLHMGKHFLKYIFLFLRGETECIAALRWVLRCLGPCEGGTPVTEVRCLGEAAWEEAELECGFPFGNVSVGSDEL